MFEGAAGLVSAAVPLMSTASARFSGPASSALNGTNGELNPTSEWLTALGRTESQAADRWQALDGCIYQGGRGLLADFHQPESAATSSTRSP